ncbi:hypothetical protein V5799_005894 [Amblyomma americanum]|uniref:3-beta hydroxysteroid dehydrogenase/isomerase domain-containing protein n=1 Tax=Amblyomma americanum TaxID=6943 RepID=A0AAQ4DXY8_AMBAM
MDTRISTSHKTDAQAAMLEADSTIGDQRPIRVVLVTGSSGMLGHHVLRELQDHPSVQEVRLFDTRPFENTLGELLHFDKTRGHPMIKKTREVVASVCDIQALREAVRGADAVIHCAALVPTTAAEDEAAFERINVQDALYENRAASGRCLVACDDTPVDIVAFLGPLIEGHGIRIFPRPVPYLPMLLLASCTQCIVGVLGHLFPGIRRGQVLKPSTIRYMYGGAFFDDAETRKALAWRPKYSPQEAARMSRSFYDTL